jgi:hypothetical protein
MTRTAFCRKSPRVPRVCWLGSWALGTSDRGRRGRQDKASCLAAGTSFLSFCLHIVFARRGLGVGRCGGGAADAVFFVFNGPGAIARNVRGRRDRTAHAGASASTLFYDERISLLPAPF